MGAALGVVLASGILASEDSGGWDFGDWSDEPGAGIFLGVAGGAFYGTIVGFIKGSKTTTLIR